MASRPRRPLPLAPGVRAASCLAALAVPGPFAGTPPGGDPSVATPAYVTQFGGVNADGAAAVAMDGEGCLYVVGWTRSTDFPTTAEALDEAVDERDAFVAKLAADGRSLVWSTVLGGSREEEATCLVVDHDGTVLVGGWTTSDDFPTTALAHRTRRQGWKDGFVAVLDPNGGRLLASSYVGGSDDDAVTGLALTAEGDLVLTGWTESRDLPTMSTALQPRLAGRSDAFLLRLDPVASELRWATYLGGRADEHTVGVAVDGEGYLLVAGTTSSSDLPTSAGAYDRTRNGQDAFLARISSDGRRLQLGTYYGGSADDVVQGLALAEDGGVVLVGTTRSDDLPVTQAEGGHRAGRRDGFVLHFSVVGGAPVFARYLGGSGDDGLGGVAVDALGGVWVAGRSASDDLPVTPAAAQPVRGGGDDAVLARLDARTGALHHLTYLGSAGQEDVRALAPDLFHGGVGFVGQAQRSDLGTPLERGSRTGHGAASDVLLGRLVPGSCGVPAFAETLASGGEARLDGSFPRLGARMTLTLSGDQALAPGVLFLGAAAGRPLVFDGVGTIHVEVSTALVLREFTTDADGGAVFSLPVPSDAELCGLRLVVQALVAGRATDAVRVTVGS